MLVSVGLLAMMIVQMIQMRIGYLQKATLMKMEVYRMRPKRRKTSNNVEINDEYHDDDNEIPLAQLRSR